MRAPSHGPAAEHGIRVTFTAAILCVAVLYTYWAFAGLSFLFGAFLVVRGLVRDTVVPGWTSTMVLVSLFSGFIIALISMIGEYVVRTLQTVSTEETFHVVQRVGR